jgi:hypothetical protein
LDDDDDVDGRGALLSLSSLLTKVEMENPETTIG